MHRIDSEGHVNNLFVDEDLNAAILGTKMAADWLNAIQEELINILDLAEIDPLKAENDQLAQAFNLLGGSKEWLDILNRPVKFPPALDSVGLFELDHGSNYQYLGFDSTGVPTEVEPPLGVNQTWKETDYEINTDHFNTSGRAIYFVISQSLATTGGVSILNDGKATFSEGVVGCIVPNNSSFRFSSFNTQIELS